MTHRRKGSDDEAEKEDDLQSIGRECGLPCSSARGHLPTAPIRARNSAGRCARSLRLLTPLQASFTYSMFRTLVVSHILPPTTVVVSNYRANSHMRVLVLYRAATMRDGSPSIPPPPDPPPWPLCMFASVRWRSVHSVSRGIAISPIS